MIDKRKLENTLLSLRDKNVKSFNSFIEILENEQSSIYHQLASADKWEDVKFLQGKLFIINLILSSVKGD